MRQPGIEQYPLRMINGITREFGQVVFDGARVPAANMIGKPGEGWRIAMTIVSHEREPGEVGYVARYVKTVKDLEATVRAKPGAFRSDHSAKFEAKFHVVAHSAPEQQRLLKYGRSPAVEFQQGHFSTNGLAPK